MGSVLQLSAHHWGVLDAPFAAAVVVIAAACIYALLVRGELLLRVPFVVMCLSLLPVPAAALVGASDAAAAAAAYRLAVAALPVAGFAVLAVALALSRRLPDYRRVAAAAATAALVLAVVVAGTTLGVRGSWTTAGGLPVPRAGPLFPLAVAAFAGGLVGAAWVIRAQRGHAGEGGRRRQLRRFAWAVAAMAPALLDAPLAYRLGLVSVSWLFLAAGALLAARALVADSLIQARAIDWRVPLAFAYGAAVIAGVAFIDARTGEVGGPVGAAAAVIGLFLVLRGGVAAGRAWHRLGQADAGSPLRRVLDRYAASMQRARDEAAVGEAASELLKIGLGCTSASLLVASARDYSWQRASGDVVDESIAPDPHVLGWLLRNPRPIHRDELQIHRLGELRRSIEHLFRIHDAELLLPLVNREEVVGLVIIAGVAGESALEPEQRRFLVEAQEQITAVLAYVRMLREATSRVEVAKEVELTAAVQAAFIPHRDLLTLGRVSVSGMYIPASRCGGDWWSVHGLSGGRVLVLVGDVTGHGIAAAMVTAAAKGCYDTAEKLMAKDLGLAELLDLLDAAVRRVGGSYLHMTCFATLIDPRAQRVSYANAGHVVPYLCRVGESGRADMQVLAARGNPLGAGDRPNYELDSRPIEAGDVLVWYTDGIVESTNGREVQFGDRRMQRLLRKLAQESTDPQQIRDSVVRAAVAFQDGHPAADDITLVVGRIA